MTFLQPQLKQGLGKPSTHTTSPLSPSEKIPQADPLVTGPNPPPHTAGAIFQEPLSWGLGSSYKNPLAKEPWREQLSRPVPCFQQVRSRHCEAQI